MYDILKSVCRVFNEHIIGQISKLYKYCTGTKSNYNI